MKSTLCKFRNALLKINKEKISFCSCSSFCYYYSSSSSQYQLFNTQKSHAQILKSGNNLQLFQLLLSYFDCVASSHAHQLFDEVPNWDIVSVTSFIGALSRLGRYYDAVSSFRRIFYVDIRPNEFTFGTTLHAATAFGDSTIGRQLHACLAKMGLHSNVFVASSLLDLYAKLGTLEEARRVFDDTHESNVVSYTTMITGYLRNLKFHEAFILFRKMPEKNVVSWNAMIGGCSQIGLNEEAVNLFVEMCRTGVVPSESTFPCVFSAAANIAALGMGRSFHASALKFLCRLDVFVGNALISFYAKSGCLEDSVQVFHRLNEKNVVSWNAVICGYAQNGRGTEALQFYKTMQASGIRPNSVTLLGLLFGCNHAGLVDDAYKYFNLARKEQPAILKAEHYACMVDLLSRSGQFSEAKRFLDNLPFDPGIGFWKSLLLGCQIFSNKSLAEDIALKILELDPKDISSYVQLSNVYSSVSDWHNVSEIRREMKERGIKRTPGCSWIEVQSKVHVFFNGDSRHPQTDDIYAILWSFFRIFLPP